MTRRAPHPLVLAKHLEDVARQLRTQGPTAIRLAPELAAHGYPAATLGDGGSRGSDVGSSTERAALNPNPFDAVDKRLNQRLRFTWLLSLRLSETLTEVYGHAGDDDQLPAGSGSCECCERMCRPDVKAGDRLTAGFCAADYQAWVRAGRPERAPWIVQRRKQTAA